jgi:hypothetical protein
MAALVQTYMRAKERIHPVKALYTAMSCGRGGPGDLQSCK